MKKAFKPIVIIGSSVIQIMLFAIFFFIITSTIEWFPWNEPLTMVAGITLLVITPIQFIITPILWMSYASSTGYKRMVITSTIHLCLVLFNIIIALATGNFITSISVGTLILQLFISIIFIRSLITYMRKQKQ